MTVDRTSSGGSAQRFGESNWRSEFGPVGSLLARHFLSHLRFPEASQALLMELGTRGSVVHVMRTTGWANFLSLQWLLVHNGLAPVRAIVNMRRWLTRPFTLLWRSGTVGERFASAFAAQRAGLVFLRRSAFNSPRGIGDSDVNPFIDLVHLQKKSPRPIFLVPELLVWDRIHRNVRPSVLDRIFGSPEAPGFIASIVAFARNYKRAQFRVGEPVDLSEVIARYPEHSPETVARIIRSTLHHFLSRETRAVYGPPRKPVDRLIDEAMRDRRFQDSARQIARERGVPLAKVEREAKRKFNAIAARPSPTVLGIIASLLHVVFNRMYDGVEVDEASLERALRAASRAPIVITPSHKSHIDYLIISYVLWQRGFSTPLIAAGANLSFFPLGSVFRRAGAFFLRRTFKEDPLYTAVFRAYLRKLVRDGEHQLFFPEGGRSRSGKLLQAKLGIFAWLVDAILEGARDDLMFVPVAIDYERVVEGASLASEAGGAKKTPEGIRGLLSVPRVLSKKYGKIHLRFDAPISLKGLAQQRAVSFETHDPAERKGLVRALGHRTMYGISRVSTVTAQALLASAVLEVGTRGVSLAELVERIEMLRTLIVDLGAPLSRGLQSAPVSPLQPGPIRDALESFSEDGLIEAVMTDGAPTYFVPESRRLALAYHRNTLLNWIAGLAIVAAATIAAQGNRERTLSTALFVSRLLKLEIVYPARTGFEVVFDETVEHLSRRGWLETREGELRIVAGREKATLWLTSLLSHLLDAYAIAIRVAAELAEPVDRKTFVARCRERGRSMQIAQGSPGPEAISQLTFANALETLRNLSVIVRQDGENAVLHAPLADLRERLSQILTALQIAASEAAPSIG